MELRVANLPLDGDFFPQEGLQGWIFPRWVGIAMDGNFRMIEELQVISQPFSVTSDRMKLRKEKTAIYWHAVSSRILVELHLKPTVFVEWFGMV